MFKNAVNKRTKAKNVIWTHFIFFTAILNYTQREKKKKFNEFQLCSQPFILISKTLLLLLVSFFIFSIWLEILYSYLLISIKIPNSTAQEERERGIHTQDCVFFSVNEFFDWFYLLSFIGLIEVQINIPEWNIKRNNWKIKRNLQLKFKLLRYNNSNSNSKNQLK